ncbi:MAG: M42 family metallopeptidase [Chloroflexaceae bacterium]|nr:M42 family metallopeptidase [Chloroflexaceae bacterium]NJL32956.1 M42 family metallopeptidase [Chloroflexaceae bacterium]NJO07405.1 M42 family metallopeptidase [Chloroflexaceae bacterium]
MNDTLQMMRELTEAPGVPGQERAVRTVMQRYFEPLGEIMTDNLGSIACRKVGSAANPTIVVGGHMDEIGFMVTRITDEGYLKFQTLGGWVSQVMLAQRVEIITRAGPILGVIGSKPPHIMPAEERKKPIEIKDMYIDIGARSKDEATEWGIRPGDMVVPVSPFTHMRNEELLLAKAWDNRLGCAVAIEVLRQLQDTQHPNAVYGVATVQEEIGLRGARTMAYLTDPDISFIIDTAIAGDTPGVTPDDVVAKVGEGPVVLLYDATMVPHTGLRDFVVDTAQTVGIPLQFDKMAGGGTDAGAFHVFGRGVPSLVLGTPVRYIHSHSSMMHMGDFQQLVTLLVALIKRLDADTVAALKANA